MTLPIVFAIAGSIALLIGLFGGGVKAKEIEVPKISLLSRILSSLIGVALIAVAIRLSVTNPSESPEPTPQPLIEATAELPTKTPVDRSVPTPTNIPTKTPTNTPANTPTNTPTSAQYDLCKSIVGKSIAVDANSYQGIIGSSGISLADDGKEGFSFSTTAAFVNEPVDQVVGNCSETSLYFS
jgi:hypothetical protein